MRLDDARRAWLAGALRQVIDEPSSLPVPLPRRRAQGGRGPLEPEASLTDVHVWSIDDAVRVPLISAGGPTADLDELYRGGDAAERRAVLRALPYLELPAAAAAWSTTRSARTTPAWSRPRSVRSRSPASPTTRSNRPS